MSDDISAVLRNETPWAVATGDVITALDALPADCVDLLFCSPPYEAARLYLEGGEDIGIARTADEWVAWMLTVCEAARRVCKGLCAFVVEGRTKGYRYSCSPFLLLADLHRRGFNLRKPPIYRRVGIPGSGGPDWLRNDYEPIICFARPGRLPWSEPTACGEACRFGVGGAMSNRTADGRRINAAVGSRLADGRVCGEKMVYRDGPPTMEQRRNVGSHRARRQQGYEYVPPEVANPGNVIDCRAGGGHLGSPLCHENEAPFPEDLAAFFVLTFCPPGGVVCDPFSGSGTTVAMALRHGRRGIGFDVRPSQVVLSRRRVAAETPSLFSSMQPSEESAT